jgi:shikimate kinase
VKYSESFLKTKPLKIYLIGFMGVGKTSKGQKLAKNLGIRFADMDRIIEEQEGMSVQEIFKLKGEEWFRVKEKTVLHQLGESLTDMVISTGGGVPCFFDNMEFINATGLSVYLKMSPEALLIRLSRSQMSERPLIKDKTRKELLEYIKIKLKEREHFYLQSVRIVSAENLNIKDLAAFVQT